MTVPLRPGSAARRIVIGAPPAPLAGGFWAALYAFRLERAPQELSGELVARVIPTDEAHCQREALMQTAAAAAGFPAPRIHLTGGRDAGLGRPYIIMDRMPGGTLADGTICCEKSTRCFNSTLLVT